MLIDWNKALTFAFSTFAIVISIITILMTKHNLKKQLRLGKLEEILEILDYLKGYYRALFDVFTDIPKIIRGIKVDDPFPPDIEQLKKYRDLFIKTVDRDVLINKILRLKILSNAYLNNSNKIGGVKVKIHTVADLYYKMYLFILSPNPIMNDISSVPQPGGMQKFIEHLESEIITEMNLGYQTINEENKKKYLKEQFRKDLKDEFTMSLNNFNSPAILIYFREHPARDPYTTSNSNIPNSYY
ncbi:hypothetical protein [Flavobacterium kingsejongi]|uniref:Uncharacterized protein n=1 Tax=Flavobacterium kingsejongi TaxID=1678728 RepID=A0A2S1LQ77_9FLAO|nr:hypothetical protein [Flavobacterium kingsejongi]AWG25910.1 hypothetical protein FK004_12095 [Flavobacterium kingsejongi]